MRAVVRSATGAAVLAVVLGSGIFAALPGSAGLAAARAAEADTCTVPLGIHEFEPRLPRTLAALARGEAVTIVAVGGASTLGRAAGGTDEAWPAQMAKALAARFPKARITAINAAVARDTAAMMIERFERDVFVHKPQLVIWETGTVDAVRSADIDQFFETVQEGISRLRRSVPEVVLMDMQYSRRSDLLVNFNRYVTILRGVADIEEVPLFPRHEIMRYWSETGVFRYGVTGAEARRDVARRLYACIGRTVADFIVRGADEEGVR